MCSMFLNIGGKRKTVEEEKQDLIRNEELVSG
jgi:hypothetical protein